MNAQVQLEKSYQAWQLLGEILCRYTYEEVILNVSEADSNVSYRYKSISIKTSYRKIKLPKYNVDTR